MRALVGTTLYGTSIPNGTDGVALVTGASQNDPSLDATATGSAST